MNILDRITSPLVKYRTFKIVFLGKLVTYHKYCKLVSVSCSVIIESILGAAELVTLLAVISRASNMLHLNVVLNISGLLACMTTVSALPNTRGILEHLGPNYFT